MRSARTRWGLLPWALFCHLLVTSLIPPPVSKLPQYATDSLKALQRGTFVLRINGILRSSYSPVPIGSGPQARGRSYRRVLCDREARGVVRGLRASGRDKAEGQGAHVDLGSTTSMGYPGR